MRRCSFPTLIVAVFLMPLLVCAPTLYAQDIPTDNATELRVGAQANGQITANDLVLTDNSNYDLYRFRVTQGTRYRVTMTSEAFDTYLIVMNDGADVVLDSNDDGRGLGTNSQVEISADYNGWAYVLSNTLLQGATGAYTIQVEQVQGQAGDNNNAQAEAPAAGDVPVLAVGGSAQGALTADDIEMQDGSYADTYAVNLEAGQRYSITMRSQAFDSYLILTNADIERVAFNDDAAGLGTDSQIDFTPEVSGQYYLVANSFNSGSTGAYHLSLATVGQGETIQSRENASVQSSVRPMTIPGVGRFRALVVGLDYHHLSGGHLDQCDDDATFIADTLRAAIPTNQLDMHLLINEQATDANVDRTLRDMVRQSGPSDIVMIFYSGHGGQADQPANAQPREADRKSEYLYLYNGPYYDYQMLQALDGLNENNSRLMLLVLDSCFSGGFNTVIDRPSRMGLFSSQEYLVSGVPTERDDYQRLFGGHLSKLFCNALQGRADGSALDANIPLDGQVTVMEIEKYIRTEWKPVVIDGQYQEPVFVRPAVSPSQIVVSTATGGAAQVVVQGAADMIFRDRTLAEGGTFYSSDFPARAGQRFVIETTDLAQGTDTMLRVLGSTNPDRAMPEDPVMAENDDAGGGTLASRVEWQCPADGTYYVAVNGFNNAAGQFTLRIQDVGGQGPAGPGGEGVVGGAGLHTQMTGLSIDAETPVYTTDYELIAGRTYRIQTANLSDGCDTVIQLRRSTDPDAASDNDPVVAENDDANNTLASQIDWTCTESGSYYVSIRSFGQSRGTFSLTVDEQDGQGDPLGGGGGGGDAEGLLANVDVQIVGGTPSHFGDYQLTAGQVVTIETYDLGENTDTILQLRRSTDPDRVSDDDPVVAENDDSGGTLASRIAWTVDQSGPYYVSVRTFGGTGGTCRMRMTQRTALPPRDTIESGAIELDGTRQRNFGDYNIELGRTVVIETYGLSDGLDTIIELRRSTDPNAAQDDDPVVAQNDDFNGLASRITWNCTEAGSYYIKVYSFNNTSGTCQMRLQFE